jgi:hypothetical protein
MDEPRGEILNDNSDINDKKINSKDPPECFGDDELYDLCEMKGKCSYSEDCSKLVGSINEKRLKKEKLKDSFEQNKFRFVKFMKSLFSVDAWVKRIQSLEPLMEVIFIDLLMIILLISACTSLYFLIFNRDITMIAGSMLVCIVLSYILDQIEGTRENKEGENK